RNPRIPGGVSQVAWREVFTAGSSVAATLCSLRSSVKRREIRDDGCDVVVAEIHPGHEHARLHCLRIRYPPHQICRRVVDQSRANGLAARKVSEIRPETPQRVRPTNCVASAARRNEDGLATK